MYQQNSTTGYLFENDKFVLVNRDEVADSILKNVDEIFEQYLGKDEQLHLERAYDPVALNQAMCRYSRDIFGEKRLHARVLHFKDKYRIDENDAKELITYEDYGIKIDSCNPYLHRRISCLFYWFSVFKPFKVILKSNITENENIYAYIENHNEFIAYIIVMMVLDCLNFKIDLHENIILFKQFLYDLHYRKLSRSALEFFLHHHIYPKN